MIAVHKPSSPTPTKLVPSNAPEHCPGTDSNDAGKASACEGCPNQEICATGTAKGPDPALPFVGERMKGVKRKILVMSGKGGVGKSTFTSLLGWAFSADDEVEVRLFQPSRVIGHTG